MFVIIKIVFTSECKRSFQMVISFNIKKTVTWMFRSKEVKLLIRIWKSSKAEGELVTIDGGNMEQWRNSEPRLDKKKGFSRKVPMQKNTADQKNTKAPCVFYSLLFLSMNILIDVKLFLKSVIGLEGVCPVTSGVKLRHNFISLSTWSEECMKDPKVNKIRFEVAFLRTRRKWE